MKRKNTEGRFVAHNRHAPPVRKQCSATSGIPVGHELTLKKQETDKGKKKLKWSGNWTPLSVRCDEVDEIYKEEDPIGVSLQARVKNGGPATSVLRDAVSKSGRYYFTLALKEPLSIEEASTATATEIDEKSPKGEVDAYSSSRKYEPPRVQNLSSTRSSEKQ